MAESSEIWIFSEKPGLTAELLGAARSLASDLKAAVVALVLGPYTGVEDAFAHGADRVIWLGESPPERMVEDYVPTLKGLVDQGQPYAFLFGSTLSGKAIAARLAARLDQTVITDVKQIWLEPDGLRARHMIFGGGAVRIEHPLTQPILLTIGPGVFEGPTPAPGRSGEVVEAAFIAPDHRVIIRERKPRPKASVNLPAARRVVCPGRGLARQEDLKLVEDLASVLGAELACTRPLAEGLGWLPRERYIGISGATIKPDLYLGVGVSGQVQHMIGMNGSRLVVAINKDENAPIMSNSDYAVVGDLYSIVPALIQALKTRS